MVGKEDDEILLINSEGIIIRIEAKAVSVLGRATQGVKIMKVDEDANIIALAKVIKDDEVEESASKEKKSGGDNSDSGQIEMKTE